MLDEIYGLRDGFLWFLWVSPRVFKAQKQKDKSREAVKIEKHKRKEAGKAEKRSRKQKKQAKQRSREACEATQEKQTAENVKSREAEKQRSK